jgi:hypothetical protein
MSPLRAELIQSVDWVGYELDDRFSIPGRSSDFVSCSDRLWCPPSLLSDGYCELCPRG